MYQCVPLIFALLNFNESGLTSSLEDIYFMNLQSFNLQSCSSADALLVPPVLWFSDTSLWSSHLARVLLCSPRLTRLGAEALEGIPLVTSAGSKITKLQQHQHLGGQLNWLATVTRCLFCFYLTKCRTRIPIFSLCLKLDTHWKINNSSFRLF